MAVYARARIFLDMSAWNTRQSGHREARFSREKEPISPTPDRDIGARLLASGRNRAISWHQPYLGRLMEEERSRDRFRYPVPRVI